MRRHVPALAALFTLLVAASVAVAHPTPGSPYTHLGGHMGGLPDLKADAPDHVVLEQNGSGSSSKLLLRFSGYIYNSRDAGTLEIHGSGRSGSAMATVSQREYTDDSGLNWVEHDPEGATLAYETGDGHHHWHLNAAASYALVGPDSDAVFAPNFKVGFCAIDSQGDHALATLRGHTGDPDDLWIPPQWRWETPTDTGHGNCGDRKPEADATVMGLTPGWRDKYGWNLYNQWVDVSDELPGDYRIRSEVDPMGYVEESDEDNPAAYTPVTLPGYLAEPVVATGLPTMTSSTIELDTEYVASALKPIREAPRFRIVDAPDHGTLNVATGQWLTLDPDHPHVVYTPTGGAPGTDSFKYQVREGSSAFPANPSEAAVSIALTGPVPAAEQVLISGATATLETATSRKLSATVTHPRGSGAITWRVQGIVGGNADVGTITADGLYVAPAIVPADDTVDISATTDRGVSDTETIRITPPPLRRPQPTVEPVDPTPRAGDDGPPPPDPGGGDGTVPTPRKTVPISGLKVIRDGKYVVASFLPGRSGKAKTELLRGKKRVGKCSARITAGRRYTCRIVYRRKTATRKLKVRVVARKSNGRGLVVRSARVRAVNAARHRHR